jgi:hypothetical protein
MTPTKGYNKKFFIRGLKKCLSRLSLRKLLIILIVNNRHLFSKSVCQVSMASVNCKKEPIVLYLCTPKRPKLEKFIRR